MLTVKRSTGFLIYGLVFLGLILWDVLANGTEHSFTFVFAGILIGWGTATKLDEYLRQAK